MIHFNRARTALVFATLALGGFACTPQPSGTPCVTATDCGLDPGACIRNTCLNKICGTANVAAATPVGVQTTGDCKVTQCDGAGHAVTVTDDSDLPVDSKDCTDDVCTAGVPSNPPRAAASACGAGGLLKCDGQGQCVTCTQPADCGSSSECQARTCVAGTCGVNNAARGLALASQTAGDCKVSQCNGNGATEIVNDDADALVDATTCTSNVCTAGVPSNPPVAVGTACSEGTGAVCDGAGACVACVAASDCAGTDTECQQRTCTAGVCGVRFTAQNTALTSQTAHDCKKSVCDGAGAVTVANDDTDLPDDNNACTIDTCVGGAPTFSNVSGVACGTGGVCSGGVCVGCNAASDCPGTDDECKVRTCGSHVCGVTFTAANTAVALQTANDCKKNVCDGSGNVVNQNDATDLPADDGNQCTSQVCVSGAPSFPAVTVNTPCSQNGGSFCSVAGACVACTVPSQCAGSDTQCQTRTCTNNACGLSFTTAGFVTTAQTPNDCQENRCDGAGAIVAVNQDSDVPVDDGNLCTDQACSAGVPTFPATAVNTPCGPGGGSFCTGTGTCVACTAPAQCAGSDTECQTRTCTANVCGFSFTASGTATSAQTPNDCHRNECDGAGVIVAAIYDADLPVDDGNQCTDQLCTGGVPSFPASPANRTCSANGGSLCDGAGACVTCTLASQCPGTDTECQTRTCTSNVCGFTFTNAGFVTSAQTPGDCKENQCNGAGAIVAVNQNADVPVEDGNQCTAQVCNVGVPGFPLVPVDMVCTQNGGAFCSSTGSCVSCNAPAQCPGTDTECHTRTCTAGACGTTFTATGTATSAQTPGDCKVNQCDGAGNIVAVNSSADVPADDGNPCTGEICTAGVPTHPAAPQGLACNQGGGTVCSSVGICVQCNGASDCPGTDTECHVRTCSANTCGSNNTGAGVVTTAQTPGDCQQSQCDGAGNIVSVAFNTDTPADDGNQCTADLCTAGVPSHPNSAFGTACSQSGGTSCDGAGTCVEVPEVASTSPSDATTPVAAPMISVTFTVAMNPATLTGQTAAGACSGSFQVSLDSFASCIALSSAAAVMSGGNTTATFTAAPSLLVNQSYKIRVTTAASSAIGLALPAQFTQPTGFTTTSPNLCNGSLVISQVYGGGGLASATYKNDFVELHNRGATTISLGGLSIQYGSTSGTTWSKVNLVGSVPPGGYFLVQYFSGGAIGAALPTPDQTASTDLASANGKVALVNSSTVTLSGGCPVGATVLDFVGYGTANCAEGGAAVTALASSTAAIRVQSGCGDINNNAVDFGVAAPSPRNSAATALACACSVQNESNAALEADYCDVQFPLSLTTAAGTTTTVFGQIYEAGTTEAAGASVNVRAQLGWGPPSANPQYEAGWNWFNATYNLQSSNNDEYQASFIAPAVGVYRYVYRFSLDQGVSWTYCDQNAGDSGSGSNANLNFEFSQMPVLTVTP